jgi:hypothetical protein
MDDIRAEALERFLDGWTFIGRINALRAYGRRGCAACVLNSEVSSQL